MHVQARGLAPVPHAKKRPMAHFTLANFFRSSSNFADIFNATLDAVQYSLDYGAQIFVPQIFVAVTSFLTAEPGANLHQALIHTFFGRVPRKESYSIHFAVDAV